MITTLVDYFDTVGEFLQGVWCFIADGAAHISMLPAVFHDAAAWCRVGVSILPDNMVVVLPTAVGGVLLFRFLRM